MANQIIEPVMGLILPTPGVQPGPQYATDTNQDMSIIASHTHQPGSGVAITPAAMNINAPLSFNSNPLYNVSAITFSAPASNTTLTTLYTAPNSGGGINDLFYNDGAGNVIALTTAGAVNATIASIPGESYSGGTFTWKQGAGSTTPANFDIGSVTIRPNTAGTTNGVVLNPPNSIASLYDLQLPALPASTLFVTLDVSGNLSTATGILATQIGNATITGSQIASATITGSNIVSQTITQGLLAVRSTGSSTEGAGGVSISSNCGSFSTSSTSFTNVTNLSVTLTTTGRPVFVGLIPFATTAGSGDISSIGIEADPAADGDFAEAEAIFRIQGPNAVWNASVLLNAPNSASQAGTVQSSVPPGSLFAIDISVANSPGTYTYTVEAKVQTANSTTADALASYCVLVAYEL